MDLDPSVAASLEADLSGRVGASKLYARTRGDQARYRVSRVNPQRKTWQTVEHASKDSQG